MTCLAMSSVSRNGFAVSLLSLNYFHHLTFGACAIVVVFWLFFCDEIKYIIMFSN